MSETPLSNCPQNSKSVFQIPSVYGDLKTHDDQLVRYVCKHESDDPDLVTKNKQNSDNKQDCNHEVTPGKKNQ